MIPQAMIIKNDYTEIIFQINLILNIYIYIQTQTVKTNLGHAWFPMAIDDHRWHPIVQHVPRMVSWLHSPMVFDGTVGGHVRCPGEFSLSGIVDIGERHAKLSKRFKIFLAQHFTIDHFLKYFFTFNYNSSFYFFN